MLRRIQIWTCHLFLVEIGLLSITITCSLLIFLGSHLAFPVLGYTSVVMAETRGGKLLAFILLASGLDFLLFGYDQGLFGGILASDGFNEMLGNPTPTLTGFVTAVYDIGCALGAVMAFIFGEKIGRKRSILIANIIGTSDIQLYALCEY